MKRIHLGIILIFFGVVAACSSPPTDGCEQAAIEQALAEDQWTQLFEEHAQAHEALSDNPESEAVHEAHDHSAEMLFDARVNMIFAEAETRRRCG